MAANSTNSTCVLDTAFHTVTDPSYNWTKAGDDYEDLGDLNVLEQLFAVRVGNSWTRVPGCFYLGTLNETKVKRCEDGGGVAIISSRTKQVSDADVWFCGLPGTSGQFPAPNPLTDEDLNKMMRSVGIRQPITCNMPSRNAASPRAPLPVWIPVFAVVLTSIVVRF